MRKGEGKRAKLTAALDRTRPQRIGAAEWNALASELAPISERYLRELLRECGMPLDPLIEGVRQDSFDNLERTLLQLEREYTPGDGAMQRACRDLVIAAKDHARFNSRRLPAGDGRRADKEEMLLWMLTWLENPPAFPLWLELRKKQRPG